jgi:hypothetical protein
VVVCFLEASVYSRRVWIEVCTVKMNGYVTREGIGCGIAMSMEWDRARMWWKFKV